jgi:hypothetical protein
MMCISTIPASRHTRTVAREPLAAALWRMVSPSWTEQQCEQMQKQQKMGTGCSEMIKIT